MIGTFVTVYVLLTVIVYLTQRSLIYLPQRSSHVVDAETIYIETEQLTLTGWVVNSGREKAVIYYGGNAENIEYNIPEFRRLLKDYTLYFVPYRGYGPNPGTPTEQNLYRDALAVFDHVSNQHGSISLIGRSLGSGVATYVASRRDIERLVLITPYDSLLNVAKKHYWWLPVRWLLKDRYESWRHAQQINAPVLMIAASGDHIIPAERTQKLADSFRPDQVTVKIVRGADHNSISSFSDFYTSIQEFMRASARSKAVR